MRAHRLLTEMFARALREDGGVPEPIDGGDTQPNQAPPAPKSAGGSTQGLRVSGDKATLGALQDALQEASSSIQDNEDLSQWCEQAYKAVAMGMRRDSGGSVTLPAYQETPDLGSFNDDDGMGTGPGDEGY